jgi:Fe-Mn family superoxide dismutase
MHAAACTTPKEFPEMIDVQRQKYPFTLPDLPYPYAALEPHVDEATMRIHHDKHHMTYVDKLNEALATQPALQKLTLVELLRGLDKLPEAVRTAVKNNGGGHYNHDLFWNSLAAPGAAAREPGGALGQALQRKFGSFAQFRAQFTDAAAKHFASGWVALVRNADGAPAIVDLKDHEVPDLAQTLPLLIVDVWEHAYYLKYQNRRPDFLAAFWQVVDWAGAKTRFSSGPAGTGV